MFADYSGGLVESWSSLSSGQTESWSGPSRGLMWYCPCSGLVLVLDPVHSNPGVVLVWPCTEYSVVMAMIRGSSDSSASWFLEKIKLLLSLSLVRGQRSTSTGECYVCKQTHWPYVCLRSFLNGQFSRRRSRHDFLFTDADAMERC